MTMDRYTYEARRQLDQALKDNDWDKFKELIESGEIGITNIHFGYAVHFNHKEILEYFLEKATDAIAIIGFGMDIAIVNTF